MGNTMITAMGLGADEGLAVVAEGEGGRWEEEERDVTSVIVNGEDGSREEEEQEGGDGRRGAEDAEGNEEADGEEEAEAVLQCTICLDAVVAGGEGRSTVRLQCGHEFHLDCIGSAFNAKGMMQCPNCRRIEKGNWLCANGPSSSEEVIDDWVSDEDLDDSAPPEVTTFVPLYYNWRPIGRLSELHPSMFDGIEPSTPPAFHDFIGQNVNAEPTSLSGSSMAQQGEYIAHVQPLLPPLSSSSSNVAVDGSANHHHWNPLAGPSDGQPLHTLHPADLYHNLSHMLHSYFQPNNNNGVAEQPGLRVAAIRTGGSDDDTQQVSVPSVFGNRSGRHGIPHVPHEEPQSIRALGTINVQLQEISSIIFAQSQPSRSMRPLGAAAGGPSVQPPDSTFHPFPPASSGPSSVVTTEDIVNHFYTWGRGLFGPHSSVNNDGIWPSSSQEQPPQGTPESSSAARRLLGRSVGAGRSPPSSPDNISFRQDPRT